MTLHICEKDILIRIESSYFVAGLDRYNNICAPIIKYMKYWSLQKIIRYCNKKGWSYLIYDGKTWF